MNRTVLIWLLDIDSILDRQTLPIKRDVVEPFSLLELGERLCKCSCLWSFYSLLTIHIVQTIQQLIITWRWRVQIAPGTTWSLLIYEF